MRDFNISSIGGGNELRQQCRSDVFSIKIKEQPRECHSKNMNDSLLLVETQGFSTCLYWRKVIPCSWLSYLRSLLLM